MIRVLKYTAKYTSYLLASILSVISLFLLYLYFLPPPSKEQIVEECSAEIKAGAYSEWPNPMNYCIEDYWKAAGASEGLWIVSLVLLFISLVLFVFGKKLVKI